MLKKKRSPKENKDGIPSDDTEKLLRLKKYGKSGIKVS